MTLLSTGVSEPVVANDVLHVEQRIGDPAMKILSLTMLEIWYWPLLFAFVAPVTLMVEPTRFALVTPANAPSAQLLASLRWMKLVPNVALASGIAFFAGRSGMIGSSNVDVTLGPVTVAVTLDCAVSTLCVPERKIVAPLMLAIVNGPWFATATAPPAMLIDWVAAKLVSLQLDASRRTIESRCVVSESVFRTNWTFAVTSVALSVLTSSSVIV